jgi:hypothetical protein
MEGDFDHSSRAQVMLRIIFGLVILSSCSMGTIKSGGDHSYVYDAGSLYSRDNLKELSSKLVTTAQRDPQVGTLAELFGPLQKPLKRVGIVIFESQIQPTRDGLAGKNHIYLSEVGKQILTENLLSVWEQSISILNPELNYLPTAKIKKASAFYQYGSSQEDYVKSKRSSLAPDDIFFLESGKRTTTTTLLNPRGMRDMSFVLVPAYEMMGGPKWSEHNKHFLNDVSKALKLDAVIIVMNELSWTAAHTDKHSGEHYPEELKVKIKASTLIPLHLYHERLEKLKRNEKPNLTLCYRAYQAELNMPANISLPAEKRNFSAIEDELLSPLLKSYKDLSQMTIMTMMEDLKKTW